MPDRRDEAIKDAVKALEDMSYSLADAIEARDRMADALARLAHPVPVPDLKIIETRREEGERSG